MQKIIVVSVSPSHARNVTVWLRTDYLVLHLATVKQLEVEMAAGKPDLVLMDVSLPKKNGFEACREIRTNERFRRIPVILCLEPDRETDKFWAQRQGASGTLVKPLKMEDLLSIIKHNLPP